MIFNLQNNTEADNYKKKSAFYLKNGYTIDLTVKKNSRTNKQNSALHLLFTIISSQLNEMGLDFNYTGLNGQNLSLRHTPHLVKEMVWRPIQRALFDIDSTTKINTEQINEIVDVLTKFFGDRGVVIAFPSKESLKNLIES